MNLSAQRVYNIYLFARSKKNLSKVSLEIKKNFNVDVNVIPLDIKNLISIKEVFKKIKKVDIIINNASINVIKKFDLFSQKNFDDMMKVNFRSIFFICKFAISKFLKNKNKLNIINISSIMGKVAQPIDSDRPQAMYISMKHAIEGLTKALCTEYARRNLKINSICPTYVLTDMVSKTLKNKIKMKKIIQKIPSNRIATTKDVANAVAFLCSENSSMINGSSIMVDGGWTAY
jgi:NAD(P)-dependent dehydrogenase (short-subunit alcohol dehydrogenase family)